MELKCSLTRLLMRLPVLLIVLNGIEMLQKMQTDVMNGLLIVLNGIEMHASGLVPSENPNF